jgi:hypothetical protein
MKVKVWTIFCGFSNATKPNNVHTENVNYTFLTGIVLAHLESVGATIVRSTGIYGGTQEAGATVTVIDDGTCPDVERRILDVATGYKELANQNEVWVTEEIKNLYKL